MKIKSVEIENMHNVHRKTYDLGDVTYFHGKNGAGKTTVLQAIQLALLGYIPGTNKTGTAIMRHANSRTMTVTVRFDNGVEISRTFLSNRSSVQSSVVITPQSFDMERILSDLELPIFNFSQFVGMSANKLKEWFINYLPNSDSEINWKTEFKNAISGETDSDKIVLTDTSVFYEAVNFANQMPKTLEGIQRVNQYMKEHASLYTSQIKQAESTIRSLVHYDDVLDTDNLEELKAKQAELLQISQKVSRFQTQKFNNAQIEAKLAADFSDLCENMEDDPLMQFDQAAQTKRAEKYEKLQDKLNKLDETSRQLSSSIMSGQELIKSGGKCTYTGAVCESIQNLIRDIEQSVADKQESLKKLADKRTDTQLQMNEILETSKAEVDHVANRKALYERRDLLKSQIVPIDASYENYNLETLNSEIQRLSDTIAKVSANLEYNRLIEKITADKYEFEQDLLAIKAWTKLTDANHLQSTVSRKQFDELSVRLTKYLNIFFNQDGLSAAFEITDKANSFSFGLNRDDNYIPFDLLSSGERCIYTLALMTCILETASSELKVILIDDLLDHLDSEKFNKLFETLAEKTDIQLILAGVQPVDVDSTNIVVTEIS